MAIVSLSDFKRHINKTDSNASEDAELQLFILAAEEVVERHLGQVVSPRTVTEDHVVSRPGPLRLRSGPVMSLTSVAAVDGSRTWDVSGVSVDEVTGALSTGLGPALSGFVRVVYQAGMSPIPANIQLATLIIAQHLWQTQRPASPGIAPFGGGDTSLAPSVYGYALPNRALELLGTRAPVIA